MLHLRAQAVEVLSSIGISRPAPDELGTYAALLHGPDGNAAVGLAACYAGDLAEGERVFAPLRAFGSPVVDAIQPMPFPVMQTTFDAAVPEGNQNYWKSTFIRELSDEAIETIVRHANAATSPLTAILIEQYAAREAASLTGRPPSASGTPTTTWHPDPMDRSGGFGPHIAWARSSPRRWSRSAPGVPPEFSRRR